MTDKKAPPDELIRIARAHLPQDQKYVYTTDKYLAQVCDAFEEMKERAEKAEKNFISKTEWDSQDQQIAKLEQRIEKLRSALECYNAGDLTPAARDALAEDDEAEIGEL